jgi:hypothetical protein
VSVIVWTHKWIKPPREAGTGLEPPAVEFSVWNVGPTHAFNVRLFASWILTESESPVELPEMHEVYVSSPIKADATAQYPSLHLNVESSVDGLGRLLDGTKCLQLKGLLTYTDVFDRRRATSFRYIYKSVEGKSGWKQHGSPQENEAT